MARKRVADIDEAQRTAKQVRPGISMAAAIGSPPARVRGPRPESRHRASAPAPLAETTAPICRGRTPATAPPEAIANPTAANVVPPKGLSNKDASMLQQAVPEALSLLPQSTRRLILQALAQLGQLPIAGFVGYGCWSSIPPAPIDGNDRTIARCEWLMPTDTSYVRPVNYSHGDRTPSSACICNASSIPCG
ncbi:hypothetical protein QAD02_012677 [Eretmocerus hayati]|uniref:Uncharacterized protein n=1 Tax=Eretmocerus hayati TaxID=131215 RepID=A0ACC2P540_9HYME|nr:hypothetical protein QAD02_012677 [Eretmocerus hayati]